MANGDISDKKVQREREATAKGLNEAVREMRRSKFLLEAQAKEGDELVEYLKQRLNENLEKQMSDSILVRRQSVREMQMIKNQIVEGTIQMSEKNTQMFQDMYQTAISESIKTNSLLAEASKSALESIKDSVPSLDSMVSALSFANPILGFGVKLTKDLIGTVRKRTKDFQEEKRKKLQNLEEENEKVGLEKEAAEAQIENEEEREVIQKKEKERDTSRSDTQKQWLERIHATMEEVKANTARLIQDGIKQEVEQPQEIIQVNEEPRVINENDNENIETEEPRVINENDNIENITEVDQTQETIRIEKQTDDLTRIANNTDQLVRLQEETVRNQEMERLAGIEEQRSEDVSGLGEVADTATEAGGTGLFDLLSGFMMGKGGIKAGLVALAATFFKPVTALLGGLMKLSKFIPGVALISGLVTAAISFFNGFTDAADILDKPENQVDFGDKVASGLGSIIGWFGGLIDWIVGLFGLDTDLKETFTKTTAKFIADLIDLPGKLIKAAVSGFFDLIDSIGDIIDETIDWAKEKASEIPFIGRFFSGEEDEETQGERELSRMADNAREKLRQSDEINQTREEVEEEARERGQQPIINSASNVTDNSTKNSIAYPKSSRNDDNTMREMRYLSMGLAN